MKNVRRVLGLLLCALVLAQTGAMAVTVDYDRQGSLEIRLEAASEELSGIAFSIHRIGEIVNEKGGIRYEVSGAFAGSGVTLDYETSHQAEEAARKLEAFIKKNAIAALTTATTGAGGVAAVEGLEPGVYFARATAGLGRLDIMPFIVAVPHRENGALVYNVKVFPKTELKPTPSPSISPSPTPDPSGLPQTGVVRWPIIALAIGAAGMIALGIYALATDRERKKNKP